MASKNYKFVSEDEMKEIFDEFANEHNSFKHYCEKMFNFMSQYAGKDAGVDGKICFKLLQEAEEKYFDSMPALIRNAHNMAVSPDIRFNAFIWLIKSSDK